MLQTLRRRNRTTEPNPERLMAWLASRGVTLGPMGLSIGTDTDPDGTPVVFVTVDVEGDLRAILADFDPTPSAEESDLIAAVAVLKATRAAILAKAPADRTAQERVTLAIMTVLRGVARELR